MMFSIGDKLAVHESDGHISLGVITDIVRNMSGEYFLYKIMWFDVLDTTTNMYHNVINWRNEYLQLRSKLGLN